MVINKSFFRGILIALLVIVSSSVNAQKPLPYIVPSEGFTGRQRASTTYDIETDSKGCLYMATNGGIKYFNVVNSQFENVELQKNIHNHYFAIHKGYSGNLWFSSQFGVSYLKGDSLLSYPVPDSILKLGRSNFETVYQDQDGLLHIAPRYHGHFAVDSAGQVNEVMTRKSNNINGFVITQLDDGTWFHFSIQNDPDVMMSIYFLNKNGQLEKITDTKDKRAIYESSLVQHKDGTSSISIGTNTLIRFRENELIDIQVLDEKIIKLFVDSRNDLWIGTLDNGVIQAENSNLSNLSYYDKGNSTAMVAESYDGGLWCKSSSMGFGYIAPNSFLHYSAQNGYDDINGVVTVQVVDDRILFSTRKNSLFFLKGDSLEKVCSPININSTEIITPTYDRKIKTTWLVSQGKLYKTYHDKTESVALDDSVFSNTYIRKIKNINDRILGITKSDLFELKNDSIIKLSEIKKTKIHDFTLDNEGTFWFIKDNGIIVLKDSLITELPYKISDEYKKEFSSIFYAQKSVWVTSSNGLLLKFNHDTCWQVMDQNKVPVTIANCTRGDDDEIWGIGFSNNLMQIKNSLNQGNVTTERFKLPKYTLELLSTLSFSVLNDTVYMGSENGLFKQRIEDLNTESIPSKVNFEIVMNNESLDFDTLYTLDYWQNNIRIEFEAINFERRSMTYSYMLEGNDTSWLETGFNQENYTNLSPGTYRFKLRTKVDLGEWTHPETITFNIAKPYWQTWWFRMSAILLVLFLIWLFVRLRIKQVRNREKEKSKIALELAHLEMRALKAQINPHFIFNSITSAILHLSKKEYEETTVYLERFASLLRRVLENSDQAVVKIAEEMELMEQYVQLESAYFEGEPILFDIIYDKVTPENINIQPTLLQPYIENAIHHGLKSKTGKRIIRILFSLNKEDLEVQIEDNGIGRKAAKKNGFYKDYKSYGMFISAKRIELLNKSAFSGVNIDDLENEKGDAMGTRIRFKIPVSR